METRHQGIQFRHTSELIGENVHMRSGKDSVPAIGKLTRLKCCPRPMSNRKTQKKKENDEVGKDGIMATTIPLTFPEIIQIPEMDMSRICRAIRVMVGIMVGPKGYNREPKDGITDYFTVAQGGPRTFGSGFNRRSEIEKATEITTRSRARKHSGRKGRGGVRNRVKKMSYGPYIVGHTPLPLGGIIL
jgi:hypothetical protein